jgi:hypothetical protein
MFRFTIVFTITVVHLIGMDVVSAQRRPPLRMYASTEDAQLACQRWKQDEGTFKVRIPEARLGGEAATVDTFIRGCEADLDQPVVLGYRYSVVADAHYNASLSELHHKVFRRFPFPATVAETGPTISVVP